MRKLLRFSLFLTEVWMLFSISFPMVAADDVIIPPYVNIKQPIPKDPIPYNPTRPHAPSMQIVYFTYISDEGMIVFEIPQCEEGLRFKMDHIQSHMKVEGYVSNEEPVWYQILPVGDYNIYCEGGNESHYSGIVSIE